jgi:putative flippase GtrA
MKALVREATWYGFASLCALFVDGGILWVLVHFFLVGYLAAATISFICGASVAYWLSVKLVFQHHRLRNRGAEFASFVAIGVPGLAINAAVIFAAVEYFGLHYLLAKSMAACVTFGCNFFARRQVLFLQRRPAD